MFRSASSPSVRSPRGFTLVELMVVSAVVVVLAGLLLSGLVVAQSRARGDVTRSTIRKIHEIIMPQYESYLRRRVPFTVTTSATTNALNRLTTIRTLMLREMPDTWADVFSSPSLVVSSGTAMLQTGPVLAYAATAANLAASATTGITSANAAECLYMVTSRAGLESDAMDRFRDREVGDSDGDGVPEFLDGWGNPIVFIRWAPAFSSRSPVQKADATAFHDPFDPLRVDANGYGLIPLIASPGPDATLGLALSTGWNAAALTTLVSSTFGTADTSASYDNITNHDLVTK